MVSGRNEKKLSLNQRLKLRGKIDSQRRRPEGKEHQRQQSEDEIIAQTLGQQGAVVLVCNA